MYCVVLKQYHSNSMNPWFLITKYSNEVYLLISNIDFLVGFGRATQYLATH